MGSSFTSAADVVTALSATQWKLFDSIRSIQDDRATAAQGIVGRVKDALRNDQHVTDLAPVLRVEQSKAIDLLTPVVTPPPKPPIDPPPKPPVMPGKKVVDTGSRTDLSLEQAANEISRLRQQVKEKQAARVNVTWVIEE
jgi:hypothetical protein